MKTQVKNRNMSVCVAWIWTSHHDLKRLEGFEWNRKTNPKKSASFEFQVWGVLWGRHSWVEQGFTSHSTHNNRSFRGRTELHIKTAKTHFCSRKRKMMYSCSSPRCHTVEMYMPPPHGRTFMPLLTSKLFGFNVVTHFTSVTSCMSTGAALLENNEASAKLITTENSGTFTSSSARLSSQSRYNTQDQWLTCFNVIGYWARRKRSAICSGKLISVHMIRCDKIGGTASRI